MRSQHRAGRFFGGGQIFVHGNLRRAVRTADDGDPSLGQILTSGVHSGDNRLAAHGRTGHHVDGRFVHRRGLADELIEIIRVGLNHVQEARIRVGAAVAQLHLHDGVVRIHSHVHRELARQTLALRSQHRAGRFFGSGLSLGQVLAGSVNGGNHRLAAHGRTGYHVDGRFVHRRGLADELIEIIRVGLNHVQEARIHVGAAVAQLHLHDGIVLIHGHIHRELARQALGLRGHHGALGRLGHSGLSRNLGRLRRGRGGRLGNAHGRIVGLVHGGDHSLAAHRRAGHGIDGRLVKGRGLADKLAEESGIVLHALHKGRVVGGFGILHRNAADHALLIHGDGHGEGAGQTLGLSSIRLRALGNAHVDGLGALLGSIRGRIVDVEQDQVDRIVDGGAGDGRAGDRVDILTQGQLTGLADVLAVEGLLASLRAKAAGLAEAIVADGDLSDLALAVQRQLHIHGACEALLLGGIAAVAFFLHGRGGLLNGEARLFGQHGHSIVHAAHNGAGRDGSGGNRVDFAAVLLQRHGRGFAGKLLGKGRLLGLGAQTRGFLEVCAADADALNDAFRIDSHADFHIAAKALDGIDRHIAHGGAVGVHAAVHLGAVHRLKAGGGRQQRLAHGHGLGFFLLGDAILGAVVGEGQGQRGHQADHRQHNPGRQFLVHASLPPSNRSSPSVRVRLSIDWAPWRSPARRRARMAVLDTNSPSAVRTGGTTVRRTPAASQRDCIKAASPRANWPK